MLLTRRELLISASLASMVLVAPALGQENPVRLAIGTTVEPTSFDPAQAQEGTPIPYYQAVYDTLIRRMPDGQLAPMLASSWEYDKSLTKLTLQLRDDVKFTDGTTFDADDVVANMAHFAKGNGPQATDVSSVASVTATSPTEVLIELKAPNPAFLIYLTNAAGFMASTESLEQASLATTPVGSGPYLLDSSATTIGSRYHFVKNEAYWGEDMPYDEIDFLVLPDETARLNALRSGQINVTVLSTAAASDEAVRAGFTRVTFDNDWHGLAFFDRDGALDPAVGDVRVRQAVNYAIDRQLILENFVLGQGSVTDQIWGTASQGYLPELENHYAYNPDKARELLAEAGYADGLTLSIPVTTIFDENTLVALQQMLADVGITVNYVEIPVSDFFKELRSGKYAMTYMWFYQPSDWQLINTYLTPDGTWNVLGTVDPEAQKLFDEIQMGKPDVQKDAAQRLNTYIVDQAWFAPILRPLRQLVVDDKTNVVPQVEQAGPSIYNYSPKN